MSLSHEFGPGQFDAFDLRHVQDPSPETRHDFDRTTEALTPMARYDRWRRYVVGYNQNQHAGENDPVYSERPDGVMVRCEQHFFHLPHESEHTVHSEASLVGYARYHGVDYKIDPSMSDRERESVNNLLASMYRLPPGQDNWLYSAFDTAQVPDIAIHTIDDLLDNAPEAIFDGAYYSIPNVVFANGTRLRMSWCKANSIPTAETEDYHRRGNQVIEMVAVDKTEYAYVTNDGHATNHSFAERLFIKRPMKPDDQPEIYTQPYTWNRLIGTTAMNDPYSEEVHMRFAEQNVAFAGAVDNDVCSVTEANLAEFTAVLRDALNSGVLAG